MQIRGIQPAVAGERGHWAKSGTQPVNRNPRFGGVVDNVAGWLSKNLPPAVNTRVGGMSLEDFTLRLMVWTIYLPQGIMALRYKQHPFEVWSRNISVWIGGILIVLLGKHPKYGFNAAFNQLMMPQKQLTKLPRSFKDKLHYFKLYPNKLIDYAVNRLRPKENYLEFFKEAGIKLSTLGYKGKDTVDAMRKAVMEKPYWTSLDTTEKYLLANLRDKTMNVAKNVTKAKAIDNIIKRMTVVKYLSTAASALLMAYTIGIAIQKAVFTYAAPLDKKLTPIPRPGKHKPADTKNIELPRHTELPGYPGMATMKNRFAGQPMFTPSLPQGVSRFNGAMPALPPQPAQRPNRRRADA